MLAFEIFDDMAQCTDDEVARLLPLVSPQRREQALRFKFTFGRYACLKSYLILRDLLATHHLVPAEDPLIFDYNPYGKPSLKDHPDIHFNISHCKRAIAVAISDRPVGIDIECYHTPDDALLRKTMNDAQIAQITQSPNPSETFTLFWTQKEAFLKCQGTGIIDDLRGITGTGTVIREQSEGSRLPVPAIPTKFSETSPDVTSRINQENHYIYTLCQIH